MREAHDGPRRGRGFGPHGHGHGRGFGRPGGWQQADLPSADDAAAWFAGRLPDDWFTGAPSVDVDREEITVVGELAAPEGSDDTAAAEGADQPFPRGHPRRAHGDRRRGTAPVRAQRGPGAASIGETRVLFTHPPSRS